MLANLKARLPSFCAQITARFALITGGSRALKDMRSVNDAACMVLKLVELNTINIAALNPYRVRMRR
jgi:hypothetical protein